MTPLRLHRACVLAITIAVALFVLFVRAGVAHASDVETLIGQLKNDDSDKVRLAAAVNLTKLGDAKAILPMAAALLGDSDKNVRGACAVGLAKLVTSATKPAIKNLVVNNLKKAQTDDDSDFVKQQAQKALATITGTGGSGGPTTPTPPSGGTGAGGIYVNVGPMSSKAGSDDDKLRTLMHKIAEGALSKSATPMATSWPGGDPTAAVLAKKGVAAFFVDGTLNELKVKESGSTATVSCKISMLLASFPDKSMFGFLNGGASVQASTSPKEEAMARDDCVSAVVEDLITKKIVPTIKSKVTP